MYGPAVFPFALEAVRALAQSGTPVIGAGGVYTPEQAEAMLAAGALAVQLDAVLWKGGWAVEGPSRSGALSQGNPAYES
ncbi:MAG: hypothetical protein EHM70_15985 [Chloroflexota bacterium]|nr:MAG: hypothetical protein EHM70_15985 [Chloroflexota bacterium]